MPSDFNPMSEIALDKNNKARMLSRKFLLAIFDQISNDRSDIIANVRASMKLNGMPQEAIVDNAILNGCTLAVLKDINSGISFLNEALTRSKTFDELHAIIKQAMGEKP